MNRNGKSGTRVEMSAGLGQSFVVFMSILLLVGCRETPTTVKGLVTLDGKPLAIGESMRGSVVFQPTVTSGNTLTGVINKDGRYQLSAGGSLTVTPSVYWVTVSATELIPATDEQPTSGRLVTPARYASATDSGFRIEVVQGENEVNLPLVSDSDEAAAPVESESLVEAATPEDEATETSATPHSDASASEDAAATE